MFPIPMRGNEQRYIDANSEVVDTFPIPMRGNEKAAGTQVSPSKPKFPIPMRGNEETLPHQWYVRRLPVSDPHEG